MEASQTCSRCKKTISLDDFPLKKSGTPYKTCKFCRMKEENNKRTEESNVDIVEDEKNNISMFDFNENGILKVSHGKKQHVIVKII